MNSDAPEIRCEFTLVSDHHLEPDQITEMTGIAPTSVGEKGVTRRKYGRGVIDESYWKVAIQCRCHDLDKAVSELLDTVWVKREEICKVIEEFDLFVKLCCVVKMESEKVAFWLSHDTIARLAEFGADLDVDVYDWRES